MIVADASILGPALASGAAEGRVARAILRAEPRVAIPHLADFETAHVLRRFWLRGQMTLAEFEAAMATLAALPYRRYQAPGFHRRAFELRHNVTAYDAAYVALAEALQCELVTADARLANAPGLRCAVRLVRA